MLTTDSLSTAEATEMEVTKNIRNPSHHPMQAFRSNKTQRLQWFSVIQW